MNNRELDKLVAKAQGWRVVGYLEDEIFWNTLGGDGAECKLVSDYHPSSDWLQCKDLVDEFNLEVVSFTSSGETYWEARIKNRPLNKFIASTPNLAVCSAVISLAQGEQFNETVDKIHS